MALKYVCLKRKNSLSKKKIFKQTAEFVKVFKIIKEKEEKFKQVLDLLTMHLDKTKQVII